MTVLIVKKEFQKAAHVLCALHEFISIIERHQFFVRSCPCLSFFSSILWEALK